MQPILCTSAIHLDLGYPEDTWGALPSTNDAVIDILQLNSIRNTRGIPGEIEKSNSDRHTISIRMFLEMIYTRFQV
ncbi:ATP synthase subunit 9 [Fusarium oxysporum f. sp. albedinis]|nr:ATP synthase subunit 9 [Fusarium oxysporum f. sp. albedinis]